MPLDACLLAPCQDGCGGMHATATATGCDTMEQAGLSRRVLSPGPAGLKSLGCTCGMSEAPASIALLPSGQQPVVENSSASVSAILPSSPSVSPSRLTFAHERLSTRAPVGFAKEATGTRAPPSA